MRSLFALITLSIVVTSCGGNVVIEGSPDASTTTQTSSATDTGTISTSTTTQTTGAEDATSQSDVAAADNGVDSGSDTTTTPPGGAGSYHVSGNRIVDSNNNPVVLHGVDRPSLEWSEGGDHVSAADFQNMANWNAKVVRIATNQCFWLADTAGTGYQKTVGQAITWAEQAGLAVIIDLHWSNPPENTNQATSACAQQAMADTNSVTFWKQVAAKYASDSHVSFELYNEPFMGNSNPTATNWTTWQNGGSYSNAGSTQSNTFTGTFQAAGMQALYNAVRGAGANNMVLIGGLNWAYDLSGVPTHTISGTNIAYVTHPYSFKESATYTAGGPAPANWDTKFGNLAATYPVVATEFGNYDCTTPYYDVFTTYAKTKGISWTSWAWYWSTSWTSANSGSACQFPTIISDWNGDPSNVGQVVKSAM